MSYYLHHIPGRMRVKIPLLKERPAVVAEIQERLQTMDGVERVQINIITGSVLIYYDPDVVQSNQLIQMLKNHDYFDETMAVSHDDYMRDAAARATRKIGKVVFGWAVGKTLEANGLAFLAALI